MEYHEWTTFSTDKEIPEKDKLTGVVDIYESTLSEEQFVRIKEWEDAEV
jgi:hypothetical protein